MNQGRIVAPSAPHPQFVGALSADADKSLLSIMSRPRRELQVKAGSFVPVPEHCCQTVKQLG